MKQATYSCYTFCENCGHRDRQNLPYGIPITWINCDNCGCGTLRSDPEKDPE